MKKFYVLGLALMGMFSVSNAQIINDDMESYPEGPYFGEHWGSWTGTGGAEAILITTSQASSGSKSGAITMDGQDAILQLGENYEGVFTLQWKMYVPSDRAAWIGFMEQTSDLTDPAFPLGLYLNVYADPFGTGEYDFSGKGVITWEEAGQSSIDPNAGVFDFPYDAWQTYTLRVDLDDMMVKLSLDGSVIWEAPYTSELFQFAGADMWKFGSDFAPAPLGTGATCEWYVDDVMFVEGDLAVNDVNAVSSISVYPTVANDVINVSAKSNISEVTVFNTAGQQVAKVAGNGTSTQVNVSALPAGVYVVKTVAGKEIKTTKVVVK